MKQLTMILIHCVLALFLSTADHLNAADTAEKKTARALPQPDVAAAWQRRIPGFSADSLPLSEIIRHLRQQFPEINFLIKQQGETEVDVSSVSVVMTLRAVTLQEFLKALEIAAQRPIQITGAPDDPFVVFESKAAAVAVDAAGLPLQPVIQTRVFNISKYLERSGKEEKQALVELEDALQVTGTLLADALFAKGNRSVRRLNPKLHVHQATKLLIAVGDPAELSIVEQVVTSLQGPTPPSMMSTNPERATKASPSSEPAAENKR